MLFPLERGQSTKEECRGYQTRAPDGGLRETGYSRLRVRVGSFLHRLASFSSVSNFRGPVKSRAEGGESRKGKLRETGHLPLAAANTLPSAAAAATATKPACAASPTLPPRARVSGARRQRGLGTVEPDTIRGQPQCGGRRHLVVSGQRREPHCLHCVYLAPWRGWKPDLRGDGARAAPARSGL